MTSRLLTAVSAVVFAACNPVDSGDPTGVNGGADELQARRPQLCTPESDRPNWPVRVLFIVENSGKMCVADPPGRQGSGSFCDAVTPPGAPALPGRLKAVADFITANASRPNVSVGVVAYSDSITRL